MEITPDGCDIKHPKTQRQWMTPIEKDRKAWENDSLRGCLGKPLCLPARPLRIHAH